MTAKSSYAAGAKPHAGQTLFDHADSRAIEVPTSCLRNGRCHECVVEVTEGLEALAPRTAAESFLRGNFRLACQAVVEGDPETVAFAPPRRRAQILTETVASPEIARDPMVTRRGDSILYGNEVVTEWRERVLGLAVDLGTTTVAMELFDLETGQRHGARGFENPQRFGGSDIMSRISYDAGPHRGKLQQSLVATLNREIADMIRGTDLRSFEIFEMVVAGNTTMRDLFFKLDVQSIGQKPYRSLVEDDYRSGARASTALVERSRRLGLRLNPKAHVYSLPLVACHLGADTAADLIAIGLDRFVSETSMLVDIGTNTEVVLAHQGRVLAASCPAGPAFEGGLVTYGMPGYDGAIESVAIDDDGAFSYRTIGGAAPQGLCGSGLIDLLTELRRTGLMSAKGVFGGDSKRFEIEVVPEYGITLSREDASNLGQAKAANYCGQQIVMQHMGIAASEVSCLYLAGGFANYINAANAIDIGFLPPVPENRIVKMGNASLEGARRALLSKSAREEIEKLVAMVEHVELETTPNFFDAFVEGCQFKPMPDAPQSQKD